MSGTGRLLDDFNGKLVSYLPFRIGSELEYYLPCFNGELLYALLQRPQRQACVLRAILHWPQQ